METLRQAINRSLNAHGFIAATGFKVATRNETLSLGLQTRTQNSAERAIRGALFLLSDRHVDWREPFLFGNRMVWLIDFDSRLKAPWVCLDSHSNLHHLSTTEMKTYMVQANEVPEPVPFEKLEHRAKIYATWG